MKRQLVHGAISRQFLRTVLLGCFATLWVGRPAFAQGISEPNPVLQSVALKHYTTLGDKQYFQVQLHNEKGEKFAITIKDAEGNSLYQETFQDKKFDRKFQLDKTDSETQLTFTVRTLKDNQSQTFKVNTNTRLVQDVVVRRL